MSEAHEAREARTQQSPLASRRGTDTQGTSGSNAPKGSRLNNMFPLGYKEGFAQWWCAVSPAAAEAAVLGFLPFNNKPTPALSPEDGHAGAVASPPEADPHGPRQCASNMVPLPGKNRVINEFTVTRTAEGDPKHHLIMLHGYGAGLAFFYRNYDMLSRRAGWKIWSLDLLGYGRSSRPPFLIKSKEPDAKITEAENWFIDALEEWRQTRGIERFTLLGHSFGGYLAVRYALKYKNRVNKLILVSPAGVPEDPYAVREDLPDNSKSAIQNEYLQSQEEATQSNPNIPDSLKVPHDPGNRAHSIHSAPGSITNLPDSAGESKTNATPRRPLPKWFTYLWEANVSPFSLVRWSGPLGPRLVSGWTSRRFSQLPLAESTALHNYAYSLFRQRGSGEYALAYVLAPGAFARRPLLWRVQDLVGIPSVWMYGDMDWMDIAGGFAAEEKIRNTKIPEEVEKKEGAAWIGGEEWRGEKEGRGGEAKVQIVQKAGHHLYLDGWEQFNGLMNEEMRDVEVREEKMNQAAN